MVRPDVGLVSALCGTVQADEANVGRVRLGQVRMHGERIGNRQGTKLAWGRLMQVDDMQDGVVWQLQCTAYVVFG